VYWPLPSKGCFSASTVLALSKYATIITEFFHGFPYFLEVKFGLALQTGHDFLLQRWDGGGNPLSRAITHRVVGSRISKIAAPLATLLDTGNVFRGNYGTQNIKGIYSTVPLISGRVKIQSLNKQKKDMYE
jgi:hypothetical protein